MLFQPANIAEGDARINMNRKSVRPSNVSDLSPVETFVPIDGTYAIERIYLAALLARQEIISSAPEFITAGLAAAVVVPPPAR